MAWLPGWTEFTVTPSPATSRARVLRNPVTPARAVLDRIRFGIGWRTEIDVIATTRPNRCARMCGATAWRQLKAPLTFVSMTSDHASGVSRQRAPSWVMPALLTR